VRFLPPCVCALSGRCPGAGPEAFQGFPEESMG
jgi:hypothetical protein